MSLKLGSPCEVLMERHIEVWRPIKNLTAKQIREIKETQMFRDRSFLGRLLRRKILKALIDVDVKTFALDDPDLVVDGGLDGLCGQAFDESGSRPAVFNYVAIGEDDTAPANTQTALGTEYMREKGTYAKDAGVGECSLDNEFSITDTKALNECGLFNDPSAGTMYCRDTYTTKNVVDGDTVKVYYTPKFQRPA